MNSKKDLEKQVMMAARDNGVSSVLFRNATARKLGLNSTDTECLSYLTIKGGTATPKEISRYSSLTTGSTTTMLDRLEKAGYITRKQHPTDGRSVIVEITPHWFEVARPVVADIQHVHQELIASYSPKELEIIADFLTQFTKNVTDQTEKLEQSDGLRRSRDKPLKFLK